MTKRIALAALLVCVTAFHAQAGLVNTEYNGHFDEASIVSEERLPAGDYDTIGGLEDVALFKLVEGSNEFFGSVFSPHDSSDVFTIEVTKGLRLVGASIRWATNLPGIRLDFNNPTGYLAQNTWGEQAPDWFVEESSIEPEVFTIENLEAGAIGFDLDIAPSQFFAESFTREQGIYSSLLAASGTCAQTFSPSPDGIGLIPGCVEGIDYQMSFIVERINVPEPSSFAIFALALMGLALRRLNSL
ncbi:PEP-CTERM sorting domain-containing protein [Alteromonas ponticola]|uniref:PEP-CTERM sorting domain-containing protein n=1 Tax=Alteromonas aquimaris TaxID=2998417 RepID=A0ABT3P4Q1_9ALTE|nr:PEP-CTERM sorting domain-containing protein [Alteromonas aquimaris]MCW8107744.1 PEP-CTERM sorting domain-containing protein [Alteromonas aquimaris]